MSKGLGQTQRAVLEKVIDWSDYGNINTSQIYKYLRYQFRKQSISRALVSLLKSEHIERVTKSTGTSFRPTSKGLRYWTRQMEVKQ